MLTDRQVIDICKEEASRIISIRPDIVYKKGFNKAPIPISDYCIELNDWWEAAKRGKQLKTG